MYGLWGVAGAPLVVCAAQKFNMLKKTPFWFENFPNNHLSGAWLF
jgi:hypothetical protein